MSIKELNDTKISEKTKNVVLHPGDCFGWYSHLSSDCHASSCLRSDWCKSYTLNRANESENSLKKDLNEIGQDSNERIKESSETKKEVNKSLTDLGKQAVFDKVVSIVASYVKHDSIKYSPKRESASLKIRGKVVAFLSKKRNEIFVELGGRNRGGDIYKTKFGESLEVVKSQIENFIEERS